MRSAEIRSFAANKYNPNGIAKQPRRIHNHVCWQITNGRQDGLVQVRRHGIAVRKSIASASSESVGNTTPAKKY